MANAVRFVSGLGSFGGEITTPSTMAPPVPQRKAQRPIPADALTELTLQTVGKIDAPAHLSNIVPFHEREARSISPSKTFLRPWRQSSLSAPPVFPGAFPIDAVESVATYKFS